MELEEPADSTSRPPPHTYEVVRGAVVGMVTGSAAGSAMTLVVGLGGRPLGLAAMVGLALAGVAIGGSVGLVVGVITGVVLRLLRGAAGYVVVAAAASFVGLGVIVLGTATAVLHVPEGIALWAVILGGSAAAATPWIRRGT